MSKVNKKILIVFLPLSFILYILFIFFPKHVPVISLEYSGILLCLFVSFLFIGQKIDAWTVRIALLFTAISDAFLLVIGDCFIIGVSTFIIVQLAYAIRLWLMNKNRSQNNLFLIFRTVLIVILELASILILKSKLDLLVVVTIFYFSNLIMNVIYSYFQLRKNIIFAIGLSLFLLCDIFVGFGNSRPYLNINEGSLWYTLLHFPIDLAWLFYFPSQICIVLSIIVHKKYEKIRKERS